MGFWKGLFGTRPVANPDDSVTVHFTLSDKKFGSSEERDRVHRFSHELATLIQECQVGEFDGDEFGNGEGTLFMYGPDADRLFEAVLSALKTWEPLRGGHVIKRYGKLGRSVRIDF
jgi:hypothetical protein